MKLFKYLLIALLVIVVIPIASFFVLHLSSVDDEKVNDEDLKPLINKKINADNSFDMLVRVNQMLNKSENRSPLSYEELKKNYNDKEIEKLVDEKHDELLLLAKAIMTPEYYNPHSNNLEEINVLEHVPSKSFDGAPTMARWLELKSVLAREKNENEQALKDSATMFLLGSKTVKNNSSAIDYLIGLGVINMAVDSIVEIVREDRLDETQLAALDQFLKNNSILKESLNRTYKFEYFRIKNTIDSIASSNDRAFIEKLLQSNRYYFKPNQLKNRFAEDFRKLISDNDGYCIEKLDSSRPEITIDSTSDLLFQEDSVNQAIMVMFSSSRIGAEDQYCSSMAKIDLLRLLIATKRYQLENEELPESLSDLSPDFIQEIPLDPFDKKELKFNPSLGVFYSIGTDRLDGDGKEIEFSNEEITLDL